jgi:DNA-binding NarL/FixJ family response regulator
VNAVADRPTRVVVVEDEALMRDLLTRVLSGLEGIEVVGSASDPESALVAIRKHKPDVALLDLYLGSEPDGILVGNEARELLPGLGVVVLTGHQDFGSVREIILGQGSGWSFLLKQSVGDVDALARAIRGAASGMTVIDPTVVAGLRPRSDSPMASLTPKQMEVIALVAQGHNNESIGGELGISLRTVDRHLNDIYKHLKPFNKPGVHARVHAVLLYLGGSDAEQG